jgi:hypothetical protein
LRIDRIHGMRIGLRILISLSAIHGIACRRRRTDNCRGAGQSSD